MGRNAKSIDLHIAEGNPNNLTKAEIAARKAAEIKLGTTDYAKVRAPAHVAKDKAASKHWKLLLKEYKAAAEQGIDLLTSSDLGILALYCKTYAEYERLLEAYQRIDDIAKNETAIHRELDETADALTKRQITTLLSIDGILKVETAINKKMDMLIKLQDRLFLNPLAKVKNVPKPKKEDKPKSKFAKFGGGRIG